MSPLAIIRVDKEQPDAVFVHATQLPVVRGVAYVESTLGYAVHAITRSEHPIKPGIHAATLMGYGADGIMVVEVN